MLDSDKEGFGVEPKFEPAPKLQALVYDTLPSAWRKVPESDARSVACIPIPAPPLFQSKCFE